MIKKTLIALAALVASFGASAQTNIWLAWDHSVSTNVVSYRVWQGNGPNSYTTNWLVQYTNYSQVVGLKYNTAYYFAVTAIDSVGQQSDFSNEVNWTYNIKPAPPTQLVIAPGPPEPPVPGCTQTMFANATVAPTGSDILPSLGYMATPFLSDIEYGLCEVDLSLQRASGTYSGTVAVQINQGTMPVINPGSESPAINIANVPLGGTNWVTFQSQGFVRQGTNWLILHGNISGTSGFRWFRNASASSVAGIPGPVNGVWRSMDGTNWTLVTGNRRYMFKTRAQ